MTEPTIRRVGVVLKHSSGEAIELGRQLLVELERLGLEAVLDAESGAALGGGDDIDRASLAAQVDLVVVLGGDGTLLSVAHGALGGTPILGINMGTLGFLTEHPVESLLPMLHATLAGKTVAERRERLAVSVLTPGREPVSRLALNDAVVAKTAMSRIVNLTVHVNDQLVSRFRGDGLIVATPTGSTAYNLSAGGPILYPTLEVMLLTPICPHTLTNRPLALPLDAVVEVRLESRSEDVSLTLDGQQVLALTPRDLVRIRRAAEPLQLIVAPARSYFEILNHKLKWGEHGG